jgi:hypothetical protein
MASGDTALSICSDALILLGAAPLSSFTEGSASAQACDRLYPDLRDNMISRYPWSWSLIKLKLNRLVDAPTNEFKYQYQLPGSMLSGVLALFSSGSSSAMSLNSGWEIYGESVFTNLEEVYIDYQASIDESKFPPYFVRLLRTAMAAELAVVITDQVSKADYYRGLAVGTQADNGRGGLFREAANIDSRGKPNEIIQDYTLLAVRG